MTGALLSGAVLAVGIGATGWCVWHCVGAMHRGRATASRCQPTGTSRNDSTARQLADLRTDLAELRTARRDDGIVR